ncbi:hypothetical protein JHK86_012503 [Glycine max]|nr:hypothetical protein JHK86_012503 [Glycine max]
MLDRSLVSYTTMLTCYTKHGMLPEVRVLFERMGVKDVVCWNVMIDGYAQHGCPYGALVPFRKMMMMHGNGNGKNNGVGVNVRVGTALADMYCKCGSLDNARKVFDVMEGKDVVAWNSMIIGYGIHGFGDEALQLFHDMCYVENVSGMEPKVKHYRCMVNLLG